MSVSMNESHSSRAGKFPALYFGHRYPLKNERGIRYIEGKRGQRRIESTQLQMNDVYTPQDPKRSWGWQELGFRHNKAAKHIPVRTKKLIDWKKYHIYQR